MGEKEEDRGEGQKAMNRELTNTARQGSGQIWLNVGAETALQREQWALRNTLLMSCVKLAGENQEHEDAS